MGTETLPIHTWFESPGDIYLIDDVGPASANIDGVGPKSLSIHDVGLGPLCNHENYTNKLLITHMV